MRIEVRLRVVRNDGSVIAEHEGHLDDAETAESGALEEREAARLLKLTEDCARAGVLRLTLDMAQRIQIRRRPLHANRR